MIRKNIRFLILCLICLTGVVSAAATIAEASENPAGATTHCRLDVIVDPATSKVTGVMDISAEAGRELTIYRNDARIKEFRVAGRKKDIGKDKGEDPFVIRVEGPIRLQYEITVKNREDNRLSDQEIVLKDGWYPVVDGFCTYEVRALLPQGFVAVSEGESDETLPQGDKALFTSRLEQPYSDAISLIASKRFVVSRDALDDIDIYTYFFSDHAGQSAVFLEGAKRYLKMYQSLIGKYPYKRFSIVENSLSSAFSMPTFILMTEKYIRQGQIEETPLGHEIVHQWFGNSVFVDYDKGNWHEGLTIYLADHISEEARREDANCRKRILIGYESYVRDNNEFPLNKFSERFDYASRSIGYGKSAMVFHMLRKAYGDEAFYGTIRRFVRDHSFRVASWEDLEKAFEAAAGRDLSPYFQQWVYDVGIADLEMTDVQMGQKEQGYEVRFSVLQKGKSYRLSVPVAFYFKDRKRTERVEISQVETPFTFLFDEPPTEIVLDEGYDVFRRLTVQETPPIIERLITDEKSIIVTPSAAGGLYTELIAAFGENGSVLQFINQRSDVTRKYAHGGRERMSLLKSRDRETTDRQTLREKEALRKKVQSGTRTASSRGAGGLPGFHRQSLQREAKRLKDGDLASASLLIVGADNPILRRLRIDLPPLDAGFGIVVKKNPLNPRKVIAVVAGKSREEIELAQGQITDYRKYSALSFDRGKLTDKTIEKAENGIRRIVANKASPAQISGPSP
jgi:hypothetical protein